MKSNISLEGDMKDVETQTLSELIVGRELAHMQKAEPQQHDKEILRVENLSRGKDFQNVSFTAKAGEILGFTGLLGDGRSELFRSIFGDTPDYTGDIFLNGEKYHAKSTTAALKNRIAYVPSNRKENAIIPDLSVKTNGKLAHSVILLAASDERRNRGKNNKHLLHSRLSFLCN